VSENRVLRVLENRVLRMLENRVLRVLENRVLRVLENRVLRVLENRVLRRIFGHKGDELTVEWRKLHIEELNDQYPSLNIIRISKSRRTRWAGYLGLLWRGEVHTRFWRRNLSEKDHLEDPGIHGRIILKRIFRKWDGLY
jgi:hypothetical protein